jgi:RNA polymerase sigma factor (sigma-70 family)
MVTKSQSPNGSMRSIVKLLAVQSLRGTSDPELLQRFVDANDEAAFRVIAERHGPMVLGVCQRALRCRHDAEDAFQATFLVFARKAASIRKSLSLSSWLHGVALRVAARLKRSGVRRVRREQAARREPVPEPVELLTWAEVKTGLDEELQRLPARYREVLILCYLEAKTRDEAAVQLGVKLSTVHGRLERGRKLLAERMSRRGLTLSAGLVAVAVAPDTVQSAIRAAALFAAQRPIAAVVSPRVLSLTNDILKGMAMTRMKTVFAILFGSLVLIAGVGFSSAQAPPAKESSEWAIEFKSTLQAGEILAMRVDESDEDFIRRISMDLRGSEPTTTEVHFFVKNKDARKRDTLIDLFVKERENKKRLAEEHERVTLRLTRLRLLTDSDVQREAAVRTLTRLVAVDPEISLLKTRVELARTTVLERELLLKIAQAEKSPASQIELKKLDIEKAKLTLKEAELNLTIAEKKNEKPKPTPMWGSLRPPSVAPAKP